MVNDWRDAINAANHPWEFIYKREGRFFHEPFPRFPEVVRAFKEHGCTTILDLGCGTGRHTVHLARAGFQVTGLDISSTGLGMAGQWLAQEEQGSRLIQAELAQESLAQARPAQASLVQAGLVQASLVQTDMRHPLPFKDGAFQGVFSTQVIHHALKAQVQATIGEIWRVLGRDGLAFVSVAASLHDDESYRKIEPDTYLPLDGDEAGLPHHIFDETTLRAAFAAFQVKDIDLRAGGHALVIFALKA